MATADRRPPRRSGPLLPEALAAALEASPDPVMVFQPGGRLAFVNDALCRAYGFTRAQLLRMRAGDLLSADSGVPDDPFRFPEGEAVRFEAQALRRDGSRFPMEVHARSLRAGGRTLVVGVGRDVTEAHILREELRASEERLSSLLEHVPELVLELDRDGVIRYANRGAPGAAPFELVRRRLTDFVEPDDRDRVAAELSAAWDGQTSRDFEARSLDAGGRTTWWWARVAPVVRDGLTAGLLLTTREVTRRKLAEQLSRAAEQRFRDLLDNVRLLAVMLDGGGRVTYCNDHFLALTGWLREEVLDSQWFERFVPPETRSVVEPAIARAAASGVVPGQIDYAVLTRDGRRRLVSWSLAVVRSRTGEVVGTASIGEDVTERRLAEEALRESEEKFRALFEASVDAIGLYDAQSLRVLDGNRAFLELYGLTREDLGSITAVDLSDEPDATREVFRSLREGASELRLRRRSRRRDGTVFLADIADGVYTWRGRRVVWAVIRDVTERVKAEEALRTSEATNRTLVEGAGASIALFSPEGRLLVLNPIAAELIGGEADRFLGKSLREAEIPNLDRAVLASRLAEVVRTGEPRQFEDPVRVPGGKRWFVSKWQPIRDLEGRLTAVQLIALDVTDRREAEERDRLLAEQLRQTQKLESLGVLAGGIAHDFNNLLTGILGNADLALLEMPAASPVRSALDEVVAGTRRAAELTGQLLAYSGRSQLLVRTLRLPELVADISDLLEASVSKRVRLSLDLADDAPPVEADSSQLRQVAVNLVVNASEALGEARGTVTLRVGAQECSAQDLSACVLGDQATPGRYAFLEVADTGPGIPPEVLDRIFEPFFTTKFAGRGLGLAAALGIVRGHHGAIRVRSEVGHGTTIRVLLPASAAPAPPTTPPAPGHARSATVLAVDDEEIVLSTTRRMLERMGFEVLTAASGREAVAAVERDGARIAVVVLDLTMPGMDGEATFDAIRALRPGLSVVLSSGFTEAEALRRFAGKGLAGFIQKPFDFATLRSAVGGAVAAGRTDR